VLLRETGFSFGGVHSRDDMGLIYAEKDGHTAIPEIKRNTYNIAGMSGTVLLPGEAWQTFFLEGTLYPAEEPRTQAEAQELLRAITSWLTAGRQRLIFDYEPAVYYLAELSTAAKWSLRNWFGGELPIRFTVQPFAYNVDVSTGSAESTGSAVTIPVSVETGQPAPLKLTVQNTGSAAISRVECGGIILEGMSLGAGSKLEIDMEPPAGATIGNASALQYATRFNPTYLNNGGNRVTVSLGFSGSGTRRASVTAGARGRW